MKIVSKDLSKCENCGDLQGFAEEQFNGRVPVICGCKLNSTREQNPALIAFPDGKLRWRPISEYKAEDGNYWHVPHFQTPPARPNSYLAARLKKK